MLLFGGSKLGGHLLDLLAQRFNLCVLFTQKAFLLLDFLCVYDNPLGRNFCFLEVALLIIRAVAVVHPLDEFEQSLQRSKRIAGLNAALCANGQIAQLDDKRQFAPSVIVHGKTERGFMDQCLQVILVRHLHGVIRGIDPFHRQFQCFSAADGTHGRCGNIHLFCLYCCRGKQCVFLFLF